MGDAPGVWDIVGLRWVLSTLASTLCCYSGMLQQSAVDLRTERQSASVAARNPFYSKYTIYSTINKCPRYSSVVL